MPKEEAAYSHKEIIENLTNANNYAADVAALNALETGVKLECIFNDLSHYSAVKTFPLTFCTTFLRELLNRCVPNFAILYK